MEAVTDARSSPCPLFEERTGARWVGVRFLKHLSEDRECVHCEPMRFCKAVHEVRQGHIDLLPETICCEGAKRAFGWTKCKDEELVLHLSEKTGMKAARARELVGQVPVLADSCAGTRVGDCERPDILVAYIRPETAMRLVRLWETATGRNLHVDISSIMAVCGNAVVKAHVTGSISISFGCPDSRRLGRSLGVVPERFPLWKQWRSEMETHSAWQIIIVDWDSGQYATVEASAHDEYWANEIRTERQKGRDIQCFSHDAGDTPGLVKWAAQHGLTQTDVASLVSSA